MREVIERGDYPGVTVNFIPGRVPEVIFFDQGSKEVDRMFVDHLSFAELNTLVRSKGFRRKEELGAPAGAAA